MNEGHDRVAVARVRRLPDLLDCLAQRPLVRIGGGGHAFGRVVENIEVVGNAEIRTRSISLSYEHIAGGALGVSEDGAIRVQPDLEPAEEFSVLVHELAHEILHKGERRQETTKTTRETEAEAVAFVVSHAIGLKVGTRSSDYIQLYQGGKDTLTESLEQIQMAAQAIIEAFSAA